MSSPFPSSSTLSKPVCVFCGSSPGTSSLYTTAAVSVGAALAKEGIPLVYGGGRRGIMGVVSHSALQAGGYVHGIVPRALTGRASERTSAPGSGAGGTPSASAAAETSKEGQGQDLLGDDFGGKMTVEVVGSMHERKLKMAQLSTGGFIVLPGGYGTFEEALEMATWNQLGIHRLPLIILNGESTSLTLTPASTPPMLSLAPSSDSEPEEELERIGNFYEHLKKQFEVASQAGFIAPQNLNLLQVVDLPNNGNEDESRAEEWGGAAVKALQEFSFAEGTGYGLDWDKAEGLEDQDKEGSNTIANHSSPSNEKCRPRPSALFTTLRYTSPSLEQDVAALPIVRDRIPLVDLHVERLKEAHAHFVRRDGEERWGRWMGDEAVWERLRDALEEKERVERGDWRVRVVLHPQAKMEVQILPAPAGAGPFNPLPSSSSSASTNRRPLILDPEDTPTPTPTQTSSPFQAASTGNDEEVDLRMYKTTDRDFYDVAHERGAAVSPNAPEVLLHTTSRLLETTTSNIAILLPISALTPEQEVGSKRKEGHGPAGTTSNTNTNTDADAEEKWLTPRLRSSPCTPTPFLNGVMRRHLLSEGVVAEADLSVEDFERAKREGRRVIGFNGLRGVWEADLI